MTMRLLTLACLVCGAAAPLVESPAADQTQRRLEQIGVDRGICVVVGADSDKVAEQLVRASDLLVYLQTDDAARAEAWRATLDQAGLLGQRVYVEAGALTHLQLADNLADAVRRVVSLAAEDA